MTTSLRPGHRRVRCAAPVLSAQGPQRHSVQPEAVSGLHAHDCSASSATSLESAISAQGQAILQQGAGQHADSMQAAADTGDQPWSEEVPAEALKDMKQAKGTVFHMSAQPWWSALQPSECSP